MPFYFQLMRLLEAEITSEHWLPGQRLPSEPTLSEHFDVSRSTVRQALLALENERLIVREKGRGTFVAEARPRSWLLQSSEGFFHDETDRLGRAVTSRILRAEVEPLPSFACEALSLPHGSLGATLERVRSVDGQIVMYVVNHLREGLAPTVLALEPHESLYDLLAERDGVVVREATRTVEAVRAGRKLASLLETSPSAPLTYIESVSWGGDGVAFDCYRTWLRTDRLRIEIAVMSDATPGGRRRAARRGPQVPAARHSGSIVPASTSESSASLTARQRS